MSEEPNVIAYSQWVSQRMKSITCEASDLEVKLLHSEAETQLQGISFIVLSRISLMSFWQEQ